MMFRGEEKLNSFGFITLDTCSAFGFRNKKKVSVYLLGIFTGQKLAWGCCVIVLPG